MNNGLYLELLDGEYLKIASRQDLGGQEGVHQSVERYLKIMALFGYDVILSDVQTMDSGLWLDLWGSAGFRTFMGEHQDFVTLRSRPLESVGSLEFSRTVAGLCRTKRGVWTSSAFDDVDRAKKFADQILRREDAIREADPDKPGGLPDELRDTIKGARNPRDRARLQGLLRSIVFFLERPRLVTEPTGSSSNYYAVLQGIAQRTMGLTGDIPITEKEVATIEGLLSRIDISVMENKLARSSVLATLDKTNWPPEDRVLWHTVVHAWNAANRDSLGVEGMVLGSLDDGIHVGLGLERLEKLVYPVAPSAGAGSRSGGYVFPHSRSQRVSIPRDPQHLNWAELDELVTVTTPTRKNLILARDSDDATIRGALLDHVKAISEHMGTHSEIPRSPGIVLGFLGFFSVLLHWGAADVAAGVGGGTLAAAELVDVLKGKWIASSLKRAHRDLERAVAKRGSISTDRKSD